jgi:hypothetical protein
MSYRSDEPEFIYGASHFDFHFYTIPETERMAVPPYELDSLKFKNSPAAAYVPPMYFNLGGGVPQMGAHWVTSPELNQEDPKPFTQTFIYGSYDGKITFMEPMITKAFPDTANQFERAILQPSKFQKTGYYPTKMKIIRKKNETQVVLNSFIFRQQQ